jgi:hypothetical protein
MRFVTSTTWTLGLDRRKYVGASRIGFLGSCAKGYRKPTPEIWV